MKGSDFVMVIGILAMCCCCMCSMSTVYSMFFGTWSRGELHKSEKFSCSSLHDSEKKVESLMASDKKIVAYNDIF